VRLGRGSFTSYSKWLILEGEWERRSPPWSLEHVQWNMPGVMHDGILNVGFKSRLRLQSASVSFPEVQDTATASLQWAFLQVLSSYAVSYSITYRH
jgi:hypothetical protein